MGVAPTPMVGGPFQKHHQAWAPPHSTGLKAAPTPNLLAGAFLPETQCFLPSQENRLQTGHVSRETGSLSGDSGSRLASGASTGDPYTELPLLALCSFCI